MVIGTSADTSGYLQIQSYASQGSTFGNIVLNAQGGQVSIGSSSPHVNARLYVKNPSGHSMTYISSATNHDTNIVFEVQQYCKMDDRLRF